VDRLPGSYEVPFVEQLDRSLPEIPCCPRNQVQPTLFLRSTSMGARPFHSHCAHARLASFFCGTAFPVPIPFALSLLQTSTEPNSFLASPRQHGVKHNTRMPRLGVEQTSTAAVARDDGERSHQTFEEFVISISVASTSRGGCGGSVVINV
jgi:hypothetical protein